MTARFARFRSQNLPGYGPVPFPLYSGYLSLPNGHHYHYMFAESANPATDPVIQFMNGGPGASSLDFFFTEGGPLSTNVNSLAHNVSGAPQLFPNPESWTNVGSILVLESPASVGFSYIDAPFVFNDSSTAQDNYDALVMFFDQKFPELKKNPYFLTGESYAGVYGPMLADLILKGNSGINFAGMAIGDGCIGDEVGTCSPEGMRIQADTLFSFRMISPLLYAKMQATCTSWAYPNEACQGLINEMSRQAGNYYVYYVLSTCSNMQLSLLDRHTQTQTGGYLDKAWSASHWEALYNAAADAGIHPAALHPYADPSSIAPHAPSLGQPDDYICGSQTALGVWLANPDVQSAIHVASRGKAFPFQYDRTAKDLRPVYAQIATKVPVLIYSASDDDCVPTSGSFEWTVGLGLQEEQPWTPWYVDGEFGQYLGGYSVQYAEDFTFLTIQGAGHEAPTFRPKAALTMINSFVSNIING